MLDLFRKQAPGQLILPGRYKVVEDGRVVGEARIYSRVRSTKTPMQIYMTTLETGRAWRKRNAAELARKRREKYLADPEKARALSNAYSRARRERLANDPVYREQRKKWAREAYQRRKNDPVYAEKQRQYSRDYRARQRAK